MIQQTLVLVKPDGVARGLTGEILKRFERIGLKIVALKLVQVNMDHAKKHYTEDISNRHGEKVRNNLLSFITEGPVVAIIFEGVNAIANVRKIVGSTESASALPGTIRGDYTHVSYSHADEKEMAVKNVIHASADENDAKNELSLWFSIDEICDYKRSDEYHVN
ncbi:nucleoside-diphosphate kinase [Candidatus Pacearchaeota archaeon]|nr:nucleoside-diphosphate kinase [Candidatus Pacearchaeota archaeon]